MSAPPSVDALCAGLAPEGLCSKPSLEVGAWPAGCSLWRHGRSSRGVRANWDREAGTFEITLPVLASDADWELGLHLIRRAAALSGGPVEGDFGTLATERELEALTVESWKTFAQSGLRALRHMVEEGRGPLQVPGPVRPLFVGPRVLAMVEAGSDEASAARLVDLLRELQYLGDDDDSVYVASPMEANSPTTGEAVTFAVWWPASTLVLPDVQFLVLDDGDGSGELIAVPASAVEVLAAGRWRWLDEARRVVEGVDEVGWADLRARARLLAVEL